MIEPGPNGRPLVLVADDDVDILNLISFRLERAGCKVIQARNGDDALELALARIPDLAVLDVTMPRLDGYAVTRKLRSREVTRTMPIILLTARAQAEDVALGIEAGADDYVKKPFDARDLRARVQRLLRPEIPS